MPPPNLLVIRSLRHASSLATARTVTLKPDSVLSSDLPLIFQTNLFIIRASSVSGMRSLQSPPIFPYQLERLLLALRIYDLLLSSFALCPNPIIYVDDDSNLIPIDWLSVKYHLITLK